MADAKEITRLAELLYVSANTAELISENNLALQYQDRLKAVARMIDASADEVKAIAAAIVADRFKVN